MAQDRSRRLDVLLRTREGMRERLRLARLLESQELLGPEPWRLLEPVSADPILAHFLDHASDIGERFGRDAQVATDLPALQSRLVLLMADSLESAWFVRLQDSDTVGVIRSTSAALVDLILPVLDFDGEGIAVVRDDFRVGMLIDLERTTLGNLYRFLVWPE